MPVTYSPLRYPGGKNSTYEYVKHLVKLNHISTYIEPYAGGAAVALRLLINDDVKRIIINDFDRSIYAFWHSVLYQTDKLVNKIISTEVTIDEWKIQKKVQENKENANLLDLGYSTLFLNRTNRSGIIKAGVIGGKNQNSNYKLDCRFNKVNLIEKITKISKYRSQIKLCNKDAIDFIKTEIKHTRKSLTFFDPPYFNKGPDLYTNFYEKEDHQNLAITIQKLMKNRYWILTYDVSDEIKRLYKKEHKIKYYLNYSISKPKKGQEFMFFSQKINPGNISDYLKII